MRLGRLGLAAVVTMLMGCATGEPIDDDGAGGTPAGGNSGTGGKADNPNGGGTGGTTAGGAAGQAGGGASSGGASSGGTSSGGTSSGGSSSGGSSSGGTSSGGGGGTCSAGQKKCGGVCIAPSPGVGCSSQNDQCTPCNPPPNSTAACSGSLCDFTCNAGYAKSGSTCVSTGGGGAPGGGGGGGSGGSTGCAAPCNPSKIQDQLICNIYCAPITGKLGLCAPVLNCCTCPS
ncbi:MAG: hypothetical protein IT377_16955 [Polyangiaceae bacterium]|nr:hypothetical protein [Polyangiaceae bacterium]